MGFGLARREVTPPHSAPGISQQRSLYLPISPYISPYLAISPLTRDLAAEVARRHVRVVERAVPAQGEGDRVRLRLRLRVRVVERAVPGQG